MDTKNKKKQKDGESRPLEALVSLPKGEGVEIRNRSSLVIGTIFFFTAHKLFQLYIEAPMPESALPFVATMGMLALSYFIAFKPKGK